MLDRLGHRPYAYPMADTENPIPYPNLTITDDAGDTVIFEYNPPSGTLSVFGKEHDGWDDDDNKTWAFTQVLLNPSDITALIAFLDQSHNG